MFDGNFSLSKKVTGFLDSLGFVGEKYSLVLRWASFQLSHRVSNQKRYLMHCSAKSSCVSFNEPLTVDVKYCRVLYLALQCCNNKTLKCSRGAAQSVRRTYSHLMR